MAEPEAAGAVDVEFDAWFDGLDPREYLTPRDPQSKTMRLAWLAWHARDDALEQTNARAERLAEDRDGLRTVLRSIEDGLAKMEHWAIPADAWNWHAGVVSTLRLVRAALAGDAPGRGG